MMTLRALNFLIFALVAGAPGADIPAPVPIRFACIPLGAEIPQKTVRGTVARIEVGARPNYLGAPRDAQKQEEILVVKESAGETRIWLKPDYSVKAVKKAALDDLQVGTRVALIRIPRPNGLGAAITVWVLSKGESDDGTSRWNLRTFGTVIERATVDRRLELTLSYTRGQKRITVGAETSIVNVVAAERSILKPGTAIFLQPSKSSIDCKWEVDWVLAGSDGLVPPI